MDNSERLLQFAELVSQPSQLFPESTGKESYPLHAPLPTVAPPDRFVDTKGIAKAIRVVPPTKQPPSTLWSVQADQPEGAARIPQGGVRLE